MNNTKHQGKTTKAVAWVKGKYNGLKVADILTTGGKIKQSVISDFALIKDAQNQYKTVRELLLNAFDMGFKETEGNNRVDVLPKAGRKTLDEVKVLEFIALHGGNAEAFYKTGEPSRTVTIA